MSWWDTESGGGTSSPEGQSFDPNTQKTTFFGEVGAPTLSATESISAPIVNGSSYNPTTQATTFPGAVGVGSGSYSDTSSAAYLALPNGFSWLDTTTGERITKIKGQPILDGGCLYYRKINFQSATLTSTPTVIDAGANAARGGLKPIIKAGFFSSNHQKIFGKIGLGGSFTDTTTQWIMCEVLIGSVVCARARIDPALIPGIAANPSGRVWDFSFDLETVDLPVTNWASVNMRGHCVAEGGFGPTTGSGSTRSMLGYTFPLEVYTNSPTVDWTVDNVLSVRVSANGSGPTVFVNSVMYWV